MGWFARSWFDRMLGRRKVGSDPAAIRLRIREEEEQARAQVDPVSAVEEGAHAARDEVTRLQPGPPPGGTG